MPFFEFGALQGLAVTPDFEGRIADKMRGAEMKRRAKLDAENKARILGDHLKFGKAKNRWDNPILKKFTEDKFIEIGELFTKGDIFADPGLWAVFKQKSNELVDNPIIWRAERFEAESAAMDDWLAKNGEYRDSEEIDQLMAQRENYLRTGDINEKPGGGAEFKFVPPPELLDTTPWVQERFKNLGYDKLALHGDGGYMRSISTEAQEKLADTLFGEQGKFGRALRYEWNNLDDEEKEKLYKGSTTQFVMSKGSGSIKGRDYHPGRGPRPSRDGRARPPKPKVDFFTNAHVDTRMAIVDGRKVHNPAMDDILTYSSPQAMQDVLEQTDGTIDVSGGIIYTDSRKDHKQFPLEGHYRATATGNVTTRPILDAEGNPTNNKQYYAEVRVPVPVPVLEQIQSDTDLDIIDRNWWEAMRALPFLPGYGVDEMNDIKAEEGWSKAVTFDPDPENPDKIKSGTITMMVPFDPSSRATRAAHNNVLANKEASSTEVGGTYFIYNGKEFTYDDFIGNGWTPEQIDYYIQAGAIIAR